jgi:hypothetical protein
MASNGPSLTELLIQALTQAQALVKQVEDQAQTIDRLFRQDVEKQAEIDRLKKELRIAQARHRKWRFHNPNVGSPVVLSDEVDHPSPRQNSPVTATPANQSSMAGPQVQVQVQSSPSAKRRRREVRALQTPLKEIQNTIRFSDDRKEKAVAAIPSLTEDGENFVPLEQVHNKAAKGGDETKKAAHDRLGVLLGGPGPSTAVLDKRPTSTSPSAQKVAIPRLQTSSSDLDARSSEHTRKKPRFMLPKPDKRKEGPPLRSRPVDALTIQDFQLRPEYVEEYDRPRGQRSEALMTAYKSKYDMTDNELLLEFLGPGNEEKLARLTKSARLNLVHEARTKKTAERLAKAKEASLGPQPIQPQYWDTDFPLTQEHEEAKRAVDAKIREEVARRHAEALKPDGRYRFRDE